MTETRVNVDHYNTGEIETIDYIADKLGPEAFRAYVLGNIIKYASRALYKGQFESDIEKIRNYAVILQEIERKNDDSEGAIKGLIDQINESMDEEDHTPNPRVKPGDRVYVLPFPQLHECEDPWVDPEAEGKTGTITGDTYEGAPEVDFDGYPHSQYISVKYLARIWNNTDDIPEGVNEVIDAEGEPLYRIGASKAFAYNRWMQEDVPDLTMFQDRTEAAPYREAL